MKTYEKFKNHTGVVVRKKSKFLPSPKTVVAKSKNKISLILNILFKNGKQNFLQSSIYFSLEMFSNSFARFLFFSKKSIFSMLFKLTRRINKKEIQKLKRILTTVALRREKMMRMQYKKLKRRKRQQINKNIETPQ